MDVLGIQRESIEKFIALVDELTIRSVNLFVESENKVTAITLPDPPSKNEFGISASGAEEFVAAWLRSRGFLDARITPYSKDGGIDVSTREWAIQVKLYSTKNVSVQEVRELVGVSSTLDKKPAIFTSSGLTLEAKKFATIAGVAVVYFDAYRSKFESGNELSKELFLPPEYDSEFRIAHQRLVTLNSELASLIFPLGAAARSLIPTLNYTQKIIEAKDYDFEIRVSEIVRQPDHLNSLTLGENERILESLQSEILRINSQALNLIGQSLEYLKSNG